MPYIGFGKSRVKRTAEKRWEIIEEPLKQLTPNSVVDIGCAEGFFVFMAAKKTQALTLGVDSDARRLFYATHQQVFTPEIHNIGFMRAEISPEFLHKLPAQDVFICMSVMHHIMYEHGYDYALDFTKELRKITNKALFFEMGHSNEKTMKWAKELPDMGSDVDKWIKNFLTDAGFSDVELLGKTSSYKRDTERGIYIAKP